MDSNTFLPSSLFDVAQFVLNGYPYPSAMKELIDCIIADLNHKSFDDNRIPISHGFFNDEPPALPEIFMRAHLAGTAEYMAHLSNAHQPSWVNKDIYFLSSPVFVGGAASRANMVRDTPAAFRRRLLFCGHPLMKVHKFWQRKTTIA